MNTLAELFSSRVKAELFRLLFGTTRHDLYVRELERRTGLSFSTVREELKRLVRLGIVAERRDGNRTYYRANDAHPLYSDLHNLVLKTHGFGDMLRQALADADVHVVFVFGSIAAGTEKPDSDLDLMVIGNLSLRELTRRLAGVAQQLGRELNPHVLSANEVARRKQSKDHFLTSVLNSPRLFIIGTDDDLARMAK